MANERLIRIRITTLDGNEFQITDTPDNKAASLALASFQNGMGACVFVGGMQYWIPTTAVAVIEIGAIDDGDDTPPEA